MDFLGGVKIVNLLGLQSRQNRKIGVIKILIGVILKTA